GGEHQAEMMLDGHHAEKIAFEIVGTEPAVPVKGVLRKVPPAKVTISCAIQGVEILVDNAPLKESPAILESGRHRIGAVGNEKMKARAHVDERKVEFLLDKQGLVEVPRGE